MLLATVVLTESRLYETLVFSFGLIIELSIVFQTVSYSLILYPLNLHKTVSKWTKNPM